MEREREELRDRNMFRRIQSEGKQLRAVFRKNNYFYFFLRILYMKNSINSSELLSRGKHSEIKDICVICHSHSFYNLFLDS